MELFDDFDLEAKGYLRADQLQQAYYEVFDQTGESKFYRFLKLKF